MGNANPAKYVNLNDVKMEVTHPRERAVQWWRKDYNKKNHNEGRT